MSRARTILCLAIAMLIASAFLVVAQDRIDIAAVTPDTETQRPGSPLNATAGGTDGIVERRPARAAWNRTPTTTSMEFRRSAPSRGPAAVSRGVCRDVVRS